MSKPIIPIQPASVKTTCPYCGVGCGVEATPGGATDVKIAGDEAHPSNFGRLCVKGSALGETVGLEGRLLEPKLRDRHTGALTDDDMHSREFVSMFALPI